MTTTRGVRRVTITMSMFTIRMVVLCRLSQIEEVHERDSYKASSAGLEIRVNRLQCTGLHVLADATLAPARRYAPDSPVHGRRVAAGCFLLCTSYLV